MKGFLPTGPACRALAIHQDTLKRLALRGEIEYEKSASGRWFFNIEAYKRRLYQMQAQDLEMQKTG